MIDSILGFFTQKILLVICGVLAGIAMVFFLLYRSVSHDYHDLQTQLATATAQAEAAAQRLRAESERVARESAEGWAAAVDYWRSNPRIVRVRNEGGCAALRPLPAPAGKLDARPAEQGLRAAANAAIEISSEQCEARLNNAALDAAQVIHLQHWIKEQHAASQTR